MVAWVLALDIHGHVLATHGPYRWTLKQCNAQVEILVKMLLVPPMPPDFDRRIRTFQCIVKEGGYV